MAYSLSPDQLNNFIFAVAQALFEANVVLYDNNGHVYDDIDNPFPSSVNQISADQLPALIQSFKQQIDRIANSPTTILPFTTGVFTPVYKIVSNLVSTSQVFDSSGNPLIAQNAVPIPVTGVTNSAWIFFIQAAGINAGSATTAAATARIYTATEYELREQSNRDPNLVVNQMSNAIALSIFDTIIQNSGLIPDISGIGNADAAKTIDHFYFNGDSGGWVGNALFPLLARAVFSSLKMDCCLILPMVIEALEEMVPLIQTAPTISSQRCIRCSKFSSRRAIYRCCINGGTIKGHM
jgi:hypothetical protein